MIESYFTRFYRLLYLRLVVPLIRSKGSPQYITRAVAVGLFIGFTPTVGFQMAMVTALWSILRLTPYRFNLAISIAWSWISNPLTALPIYYVFLVTGSLLTGQPETLSISEVRSLFETQDSAEASFLGNLANTIEFIATRGFVLIIGCIPYAVGLSVLGYFGTGKFLQIVQARRKRMKG